MNKTYRSIYNHTLDTWVAVSECAKGHISRSLVATPVAVALMAGATAAQAVCPIDNGGTFNVSSGETCTAAQTAYQASGSGGTITASGSASVVNLSAPDVSILNYNDPAIATASGGVVNALGNVTAESQAHNGRTVNINGGSVSIAGNLVASRTGTDGGGSVIQLYSGGGSLTVGGTTTINANSSDGLRNEYANSQARFEGDATFNIVNYSQGILNGGTTSFGSNLTINATDVQQGIKMNAGTLTVAGDLNLAVKNTAPFWLPNAGKGVVQTGGNLSISGNALISTNGGSNTKYTDAINISGGTFEALGNASVINAQGDRTANNVNDGADGIHVTGGVVALGTSAASAPSNTTAVLLESGSVTASNYGIYISAAEDVLARVGAGASVAGAAGGLRVENVGAGTVNVVTAGTITSTTHNGINASNLASGTNITVNQTAGSITGAFNGIEATNRGTGSTSITTAGAVTSTSNFGIYAHNFSSATDITISQTSGSIIGHDEGIRAFNGGSGATSVTTAGTVVGTNSDGIMAFNLSTSSATDLTVNQTAGSISAKNAGINASNGGTGSTSVSVAGNISVAPSDGSVGMNSVGVHVYNDTTAANITINQSAGTIEAGYTGITAHNKGTGTTSITTAGTITSTVSGTGISALHYGTDLTINQSAGSISGANRGIQASNNGTGATSITTAGDITSAGGSGGGGIGIAAHNDSQTTNLTINQTAGNINAAYDGINAYNSGAGATSITTAGTVVGASKNGIYASHLLGTDLTINQTAGSIRGGQYGIYADNKGTGATTITTAGSVFGDDSGTMSNMGGGSAIYAKNSNKGTDITITQGAGSISGNNGIYTWNTGTGATTITAEGSITASGSDSNGLGIYGRNAIGAGTDVTITQTAGSSINANVVGIAAFNEGRGATTVTTAGAITSAHMGVSVTGGDRSRGDITFTQAAGSSIIARSVGIYTWGLGQGAMTITTAGSVTGTNNFGIFAENCVYSTDVTINQSAGSISGATGILAQNAGTGTTTITTAATVTSSNNDAIRATNNGTATDITITQSAGNITGATHAIDALNNGTGATTITTAGDLTGSSQNSGIFAENTATATNLTISQTAGRITGGNGITAWNGGSGGITTITASGTISGNGIPNDSGTGVWAHNINNASDINITQSGGSIDGTSAGIYAWNDGTGATTITTDSMVTSGGHAVCVDNGVTATNVFITQSAGTINGNEIGIHANNQGTGTTTINTAGSVIAGSNGIGINAIAGSNGGAVTINQNAGSISGGLHGIFAGNDNLAGVTINSAGTITGGSGAGIFTGGPDGDVAIINLNAGSDVSATSGVAIKGYAEHTTLTMNSGSKLSGMVLLGDGSDTMIVKGTADLSGATLLDGNNDLDNSNVDIAFPEAIDLPNRFNFEGTTQSLAGSIMKNWQTVTLDASNVTFTGDANLVTGSGINDDGSLQGLFLKNGSTLSSPVTLAVTGNTYIDATSKLSHALGGTITGNVTNAGSIEWRNLGQTLTVTGNYVGVAGSTLSLETYMGDDSSATDKLHVTGNTSGTSMVTVRPVAGSLGAKTVNGIQIIQVDGTSAAGSFKLASPVRAGAYEYVLQQGGAISGGQSWYLTSAYTGPVIPPTPDKEKTPNIPIYDPSVPNYVAAQAINAAEGILQLSTFHQRMGAQRTEDIEGRQTWARAYTTRSTGTGDERFEYEGTMTGVQLGQEVSMRRTPSGSSERVALTFDYSFGDSDVSDRVRPLVGLSESTGGVDTQTMALGATYTLQDTEGGYFDVVGQLASVRNEFSDSYGGKSKQNAARLALSLEGGHVLTRWAGGALEVQGQVIYMHTRYNDFSDARSKIDAYNSDVAHGRVGVRVFSDAQPLAETKTRYYAIANLRQDFTTPKAINVGGTQVEEDYSRTSAEVGLGVQHQLSKNSYAYFDGRYQHSLDGGQGKGYQLNLGVKVAF